MPLSRLHNEYPNRVVLKKEKDFFSREDPLQTLINRTDYDILAPFWKYH